MVRAAVLIGVKKTGNLPELSSVFAAVRSMENWLKSQHVPEDRIAIVTDESGPVGLDAIKEAVEKQLKDDVEQLIVYFTGHGVYLRNSEYWLLTRAPKDPQAAVNLDGSVALARQCGVPYVVFISDACRTAAEGVQAQNVTGGEIFPNDDNTPENESPVDIFFACGLGKPSLEIETSSVYTQTLLTALNGAQATVLEHAEEEGRPVGIVRPRPLGKFLQNELPKALLAAKITSYTQLPVARITSDSDVWLSKVPLVDDSSRRLRAGGKLPTPAPPNLDSTIQKLLMDPQPLSKMPGGFAAFAGAQSLREAVARNSESFGPDHFETECGFKVRGASIVEALSFENPVEIVDRERQIVRADPQNGARPVMLAFDGGSSVLLPAIPGYVCALSFTGGDLADVSYEPSSNTPLSLEGPNALKELRDLRTVIASSAQLGVFRLEPKTARDVATRIRYNKFYDPTMAIFAAYAFADLRMRQDLLDMELALRQETHVRLFDVAMLARRLNETAAGPLACGRFPLLSQGWALLAAYGVKTDGLLKELQPHLKSTLWTSFEQGATPILRNAQLTGELQ